jgi:hypothetical protein
LNPKSGHDFGFFFDGHPLLISSQRPAFRRHFASHPTCTTVLILYTIYDILILFKAIVKNDTGKALCRRLVNPRFQGEP